MSGRPYHIVAAQRLGAPPAAAAGGVDHEVDVVLVPRGQHRPPGHDGVHGGRPGDGDGDGARRGRGARHEVAKSGELGLPREELRGVQSEEPLVSEPLLPLGGQRARQVRQRRGARPASHRSPRHAHAFEPLFLGLNGIL